CVRQAANSQARAQPTYLGACAARPRDAAGVSRLAAADGGRVSGLAASTRRARILRRGAAESAAHEPVGPGRGVVAAEAADLEDRLDRAQHVVVVVRLMAHAAGREHV